MSEFVVRMEMPKDKSCPFDFNLPKMGPWCWIEDKSCSYWEANVRPSWCPIICQLPEGHGRLIDAEELSETVKQAIGTRGSEVFVLGLIEEAPTIIPAERRETCLD